MAEGSSARCVAFKKSSNTKALTGPEMPEASSSIKRRSVSPSDEKRRVKDDAKGAKKQRLNGEDTSAAFHIAALPNATRYQRSLMHRDTMTFVVLTPFTHFIITASVDGHVKFWKKQESGIEFVKHYRAHLAPVVGLCTSADGKLAASISSDGTAKVYDVVNFDLINMIKFDFTPRACCWVHKRGRADTILAVSEEGSKNIHLFDGQGGEAPMSTIDTVHQSPCHLLTYNEPADCIISADLSGMVEYWTPSEPYELPKNRGLWEFKSRTDLFDFKKSKSTPTSLVFSQDYTKFVAISALDRQVRVFDFASGKLLGKYDESLKAAQEMQARANEPGEEDKEKHLDVGEVVLDDMEFGRRLATERDLDASALDAVGEGVRACTGACTANAVFDESGRYIIYGSMLGVKVRDTQTGKVEILLGKDETMRFLNVCLFQGMAKKRVARSIALAASDNPLLAAQIVEADPTLFLTAFKRARFYMFTRQEPDNDPRSKSGSDRDIFNEKPTREEQTIATVQSSTVKRSTVSSTAVLHTTKGDIHLRLFPEHVNKTVENFVGLARKGYYDNVLFHRVIKKFMLQTGDPLGDGTGGESLWGKEFEDEFTRELRHDRPYCLSMANAGPNTNGSQFFITTVPTPWLDDKHTVFGRATGGFDVIHSIENARTERSSDKPEQDIKILNITL
ncbi:hypothetical protein CBS101457_006058 [Exobasidium rhododendri]|nr:hypothetical protein CBS101457_006058 [Exobasidium rhododendri]